MKSSSRFLPLLAVLLPAAVSSTALAAGILSPNDFIIGIDGNRSNPGATNTGGEGPTAAFDGNTGTKWLSFGRSFTGLIVTPPTGTSIVQSLSFTTGGDAPERDPVRYQLFGTNSAITSVNNDTGLAEPWTFIGGGLTGFGLPTDPALGRNATGATQTISNTTTYTSYKVVFTQLRSAGNGAFDPVTLANAATPNSLQISEVRLFDNLGTNISNGSTAVVAIDQTDSFSPATERPLEAIDGFKTASSKYLNFGREGAGLIITPAAGSTTVRGLQLNTGGDVPGRDPSRFQIFGTNSSIVSIQDSEGNAEPWTLISDQLLTLPDARNTDSGIIGFTNETAYTSYKIVFPENKGPDGGGVDSIQFSELELFTVPEPASALLLGMSAAAMLGLRRRRA
jgi:hypothetical protein